MDEETGRLIREQVMHGITVSLKEESKGHIIKLHAGCVTIMKKRKGRTGHAKRKI